MMNTIRTFTKLCGARRAARRARDWVLNELGCPQAYQDLAQLAHYFPNVAYFDIGCHNGSTIERFLDAAGDLPCVAFDPSSTNLDAARKRLAGRANVTFVAAALGAEDGHQLFHQNANEQTSSLLPNAVGNLRSFPDATRLICKTQVRVIRLDTWVGDNMPQGPVIVKCDTQGAEAKVIQGGRKFFSSDQLIAFYCEIMLDQMYEGQSSFQQLRELLEDDCGLVMRQVYPCLHDNLGRAVQCDALWVRASALQAFKSS